ncbi:DUF6503 family protein [Ichthyenterobacterium magnum]|uniref:Threonine synthase n=1 Tax=Ichthyenterobacterium magnum TaxID=1230530 RepID=A0A420DGW8_9FLAO|nr:DUF6503 family protein [Ichthyenterobacterium magnum]RKE92327.1 hypothetical protein BXY80_2246 [Ichthyenterobacterium magnum]
MKFKSLILVLLVVFSCKDKVVETVNYSEENLDITTSVYPENINRVFDAHGGLDKWNEMQSLIFTMPSEDGNEITTTNLKSRESLIDMPKHTIGFNGSNVWMHKKDTTSYRGNPKFYYNLMFYFYAMPFILADDGIVYTDVEPLDFEGNSYPGIKISYESGVGESPDDEYILYYDEETYRMVWLGYTVTYFSKEKSKEFHFINYSDWQTVDGLLLPETLTWYNYEDNKPTTKRNDLKFTNIILSKQKIKPEAFTKPDSALIIE